MDTTENNKLIAEFMGFRRYYPNMTELSKEYIYGKWDLVFHESLYTGAIEVGGCANETNGQKYQVIIPILHKRLKKL